jgi:hypothetical protein
MGVSKTIHTLHTIGGYRRRIMGKKSRLPAGVPVSIVGVKVAVAVDVATIGGVAVAVGVIVVTVDMAVGVKVAPGGGVFVTEGVGVGGASVGVGDAPSGVMVGVSEGRGSPVGVAVGMSSVGVALEGTAVAVALGVTGVGVAVGNGPTCNRTVT